MEKVGVFEWVVNNDLFIPFLSPPYVKFLKPLTDVRVLVVGCGTSDLSASLFRHGFGHVISIDNDEECIKYMKNKHKDNIKLEWYVYDIITQLSCDEPPTVFPSQSFDVVVDKSALDAIIVEGSVYTMLYDIHRMLSHEGSYIVCSLHWPDMLGSLLKAPELNFSVNSYQTERKIMDCGVEMMRGSIYICNKILKDHIIDKDVLKQQEKTIMDQYLKVSNPLMTEAKQKSIVRSIREYLVRLDEVCAGCSDEEMQIAPDVAYNIIFCESVTLDSLDVFDQVNSQNHPLLMIGYSKELFHEDLEEFFCGSIPEKISISQLIDFIHAVQ